eukprot:scaffold1397_cov254-Pinguiococcus_pyrenoidosus.AAC.68
MLREAVEPKLGALGPAARNAKPHEAFASALGEPHLPCAVGQAWMRQGLDRTCLPRLSIPQNSAIRKQRKSKRKSMSKAMVLEALDAGAMGLHDEVASHLRRGGVDSAGS